jgi:hypothetical protein
MKIIELKEIYMMCYLMALQVKTVVVYHNILANNMERIPLSKLYKFKCWRITHKKLYLEIWLSIWRTKLFGIFGYEEGGTSLEVFDDIVSDLKIDTLYIDKTF